MGHTAEQIQHQTSPGLFHNPRADEERADREAAPLVADNNRPPLNPAQIARARYKRIVLVLGCLGIATIGSVLTYVFYCVEGSGSGSGSGLCNALSKLDEKNTAPRP
jgi:hypothetical protein